MADHITLQAPEVEVKPVNARKKIDEVRTALQAAKDQDLLDPKGEELLNAIDTGALVPSGAGIALQGATLNFSDELLGSIHSLFGGTKIKTVESGLKSLQDQGFDTGNLSSKDIGIGLERQSAEQFRQENPKSAIGLEMAGGFVPSILTGGGATPYTLGKAITSGLLTGAGSGYGATEEGNAGQQGTATAIGGGAGAVISGGLHLGGNIVGNAGKSIVNSIFSNPNKEGIIAGRQIVKNALENDVGSLDNALTLIASKKSGKQYTPADIGSNASATLDAAMTLPSAEKNVARKFLEERNKGIPSRLTSDIQDAFGNRAAFFDEFNALKQSRTDTGKKLYQTAFEHKIPVDSNLTTLLQRPSIQQAYQRGVNIAAERGIKTPNIILDKSGKLFAKSGSKLNPIDAIDTEFLHYVKMGLDDLVFTGKSATSGIGNTQLKYIKDTRSEFLNLLDNKNKAYKYARDYWADDTAALDAMKSGRNFLKADPDELAHEVSTMSNSEKEAFRLGAMSDLIDKVGGSATSTIQNGVTTVVGNPARNILKDPKKVRLIRATFPNNAQGEASFKKFINNFLDEMDMQATYTKVLGGSATQPRQEAVKAFRGTVESVTPPKTVTEAVLNLLVRDQKRAATAREEAAVKEAIKILTATDPTKIKLMFDQMQKRPVLDVVNEVLSRFGKASVSPYTTSGNVGQAASSFQQTVVPNPLPKSNPKGLLHF